MQDDLIERLRDVADAMDPQTAFGTDELIYAGIDRIEALEMQLESANEALREQLDIREALEAENVRLREALEQFLSLIEYQYCGSREAMNALQEADNSARDALEPMSKENAETFARSGNV